MNTATNPTGILVDCKKGYNGLGNINLALRKFQAERPAAVATEIHIHPQTIKAEGINPDLVRKQTGLRLVTDREVRENRVQIIGLEGV